MAGRGDARARAKSGAGIGGGDRIREAACAGLGLTLPPVKKKLAHFVMANYAASLSGGAAAMARAKLPPVHVVYAGQRSASARVSAFIDFAVNVHDQGAQRAGVDLSASSASIDRA